MAVLANLRALQTQQQVLLGHQNTTGSGVGWRRGERARGYSDFQAACGAYPAVYGWELAGPPGMPDRNWDNITYPDLLSEARAAHGRGGLNIFCLHPARLDKPYTAYNAGGSWDTAAGASGQYPTYVSRITPGGDLHAQFTAQVDHWGAQLAQLKTEAGEPIPFVLRPWHESDGGWFWWGTSPSCTTVQYQRLMAFTVNRLREHHGLHQMMVCHSPALFTTKAQYLERYLPDLIDIPGFDRYYESEANTPASLLATQLRIVCDLASEEGKPAAWAEGGQENPTDFGFLELLAFSTLASGQAPALFMFWANYSANEFYVPHAGSSAEFKDGFTQFTQLPRWLVEGRHPDLFTATAS